MLIRMTFVRSLFTSELIFKNIIWGILALCLFSSEVRSQNDDVQVGSSLIQRLQSQGAYYDYSDPEALNIKVAVWGFVRYPGKYIIPASSNINDLLSYAGGPTNDTEFEKMSLIRTNYDSTQTVIDLNYKDILFDEQMQIGKPMQLSGGDILVVPGEPRLYFRDYLSITLSVVSALISLSILIFK